MSYVDVCCSECRGDVVCLGCGEIDIASCRNCGAEVELPHFPARETYDPEAVRALVTCVLKGNYDSLQWRADLDQLAFEVRRSEYVKP